MENNKEIVLKISRINIKSETFCAPWDGKLYCVDICEDAEERGAWLYESNSAIKTFMFGYKASDMGKDEFVDLVFSNLPQYIDGYVEDMEMYEEAVEHRYSRWECEPTRDDWDEE